MNAFRDYDYVLQRHCFCIPESRRPGLVQVRDDAIATVLDAETLEPLDPLFFRTVDGLFDELQDAIDQSAAAIQATFDSTFSYPTSIWIDFDLGISDEELIYSARDLRVVQPPGDLNGNGLLDIDDLELLTTAVTTGSTDMQFDMDQSGVVDLQDRVYWVKELKYTWIGDADLNGGFNSSDFVQVFEAGKYELAQEAGWAEGDWNGDQAFDSADFVAAFIDGGYEQGPRPRPASVPEPGGWLLLSVALLTTIRYARRVCPAAKNQPNH